MENNTKPFEVQELSAFGYDSLGNAIELSGHSVSEIAAQLPDNYIGPTIKVFDEAGFLRGWVKAFDDWRAQ